MNTIFSVPRVLILAALACGAAAASGAQLEDEQQLVQVLTSSASPKEKDAACQKLKLIGTTRSVPALAALLLDEELSHSARYVLEPMPFPEAATALLGALDKTTGPTRVGIIGSLGARAEPRAVPALGKLLSGVDPDAAVAAARALGQIAQSDALQALQSAAPETSGAVHVAVVDGLLRCANHLVLTRRAPEALAVFEKIYGSEKGEMHQVGAYRGMIQASSGGQGLKLITRAITGPPGPAQVAALQMAREIQATGATEEVATLLSRVAGPVQVALAGALQQRGDPAAAPALAALVSTAVGEARVPILTALGELGDASVVPVLAKYAARGTASEQPAARRALVELRRGGVVDMLVGQLATGSPEVQAEAARALGDRSEKAAVPRLLDLAQNGSGSARNSALKALGLLIDEAQLAALIQLVIGAQDAVGRAAGAEAVNYACQRIVARRGALDAKALAQGATRGPKVARIALLPVCSGLINPETRASLRSGLKDPDPDVRIAAARALCDTIDPELLEDVIGLARSAKEDTFRSLAIAGGVRLVTQEETVRLSNEQRLTSLRTLLGAAVRPEEKRLALAGLGEIPDLQALRMVEPLLEDNALQVEAARAAMKIAATLPAAPAREAVVVLRKGLAVTRDGPTRQGLETVLKQLQERTAYITDWLVAGPFRQEGKNYAALFDIMFPPEPDGSKGGEWKPLPAGTDPQRPYVMDLLKALGGEQCVAYVRTWVHSDRELPALLDLGSDDGVKIWLNGHQVYALNTARPLQPGSDKVNLTLRAGWNLLLLKVTQNNLGWEFCARLLKPDGSHLEGVGIEAARRATSGPAQ